MMDVTDDMLMALADGELDEATATELRARVAQDPALQRRYGVFANSAARLRAALHPGPVPDRLIDAILKAPAPAARGNVVPLRPVQRWWLPLAVGVAAGVATVAIGLGGASLWRGAGSITALDPAQYAELATGTERELRDGSRIRMLGTYETDMGLCRMASVDRGDLHERRIICRNDTHWQVALRLEVPAVEGFQPASDSLSGMADQWLEMMSAGQALELGEEKQALGRGGAQP